jgi:putative DNA primase/helicase
MAKSPASSDGRSHLRFVDLYLKKYPDTRYSLGEWKRYDGQVWRSLADLSVRKECQALCRSAGGGGLPITSTLVGSVYKLLQTEVFLPDDTFDQNSDLIAFADKTLVVSTGEVRLHRASDYLTSYLPFTYDPRSRSPDWEAVLTCTDSVNVPFLQEFAGYSLTPSTKYDVAVWSWGEPGSAKSTFIVGIEAVLGVRCCVLGLANLGNRFSLSQLPGKTLAISTEQPSTFVHCFDILNALMSGDSVQIERKYMDAITVKLNAKILWAMNELPRVDSGPAAGLFRRVVPVRWNRVENPNPEVRERVKQSGPSIFNWAYEGLKRLNQRGKFHIPPSLIADREAYQLQNDPIQVFLNETYNRLPETTTSGKLNRIRCGIIYEKYKDWCSETSHKPITSIAFAKEMRRLKVEKREIKGYPYFLGIGPKPANSSEIEVDVSI